MSMILNQSESEDQRVQPVTEVTTVIGGDLTIPAGTHLEMQGIVRLEGTLTIEDGGGVTISQPPAMHRVFSRQDAERSLAEDSLPSAAEIASLLPWADSLPSAAEIASLRSLAESLEIGKAPAMMAAADHLSGWYTATDKQAEVDRLISAITRPPDNTVQRLLALGEIEGWLKPKIELGDLSQEVNAMIAIGDVSADALTLQERARLLQEGLLAQSITTNRQVFATELAAAAAAQMDQVSRTFVDMVSSQVVIPTVMEAAEAMRRMIEPAVVGASIEAVRRMIEPTVQSFAEQHRQMTAAALAATAFMQPGLHAGGDAWRAPAVLAPEPAHRPVQQPPAQPVIVEVVQVASTDWQEVLAAALREGKASPKQVIAWLHGMSRPGQKPPDWAEVEAVALMYKRHGHLYSNYETFVGYLAYKGVEISVGTFKRWLRIYEAATGEQLRPGRKGRRKIM